MKNYNEPDNYLPLLEKHKELFVDWLFEIAKQEDAENDAENR